MPELLDEIDLDDVDDADEAPDERQVTALPMPVARVRDADRDRLLTLLRERVPDPSVFEEREPFLWQMVASNTNLDSYFTTMHRSTLENFAADASVGVSFQNSHRWGELPFGRTLRGQFREKRGENPTRALIDGYTVPDLTLNGVNTSELIAGMRAGIVSDVSVGFYGGRTVCDLCGGDYNSYRECPHWLGFEYEPEGGGEKTIATATIHEARLAEVSAVYDGATPGAGIVKVYRCLEGGALPEPLLAEFGGADRLLKEAGRRYRSRVRYHRPYASVDLSRRSEELKMADKQTPPEPGVNPEWRVALKEAGLDPESAPLVAFRSVWSELVEQRAEAARLPALAEEVARLKPLADDGKTYRADLLEETISEGKRAFGTTFREETQRSLLAEQPLAAIKETRDMWRAKADETFTTGRVSGEGEPNPEQQRRPVSSVPAAAFRA